MKKTIISIFMILLIAVTIMSATVLAGGDQNMNNERGELGQGETAQICITPDYTDDVEGPCPYGYYNPFE